MIISGGAKLSGGWKQDANRGGLIYRAFDPEPGSALSGLDNQGGHWNAFNPRTWALTLNSVTKTPTCAYRASRLDSATGNWKELFGISGGLLPLAAGAPTYNVLSVLGGGGGDDVSVTGDGAASRWQAAADGFAQLSTDDFVMLAVVRPGTVLSTIAGKITAVATDTYWEFIQFGATGQFRMQVKGAGGSALIDTSANAIGSLCIFMLVYDKSGSMRLYLNGATVNTTAVSGVGDLDMARRFMIAGRQDASLHTDATINALAVWQGASWLDTHVQDAAVLELTQRIMGIYPQLSPTDGYTPTFTRATTKYIWREDQGRLHQISPGMLIVDDQGVLIEGAATNRVKRNQVVGGGLPWNTRGTATVVDDTADLLDPNGKNKACKVTTLGAVGHDIFQVITDLGVSVSCAPAFWIKRISVVGILTLDNNVGAPGGRWTIDLAGLPDAWVRITRSSTYLTVIEEYVSHSDERANFNLWTSTGNMDFYLYNPHMEGGGVVEASSDIVTDAGVVTRNADDHDADPQVAAALNAAGEGTIECEIVREMAAGGATKNYIWSLNDGSGSNYLASYVYGNGTVHCDLVSGGIVGATLSVLGDICDGAVHVVSVSIRSGKVSLLIDGTEVVDTSGVVFPVSPDAFQIGAHRSTISFNGHIHNMRAKAIASR